MSSVVDPGHDTSARGASRSVSRLRQLRKADYAVGVGLLFATVFLWTASNFVTQGTFDGGYVKPFFVTYMNTSAFLVYLVPYALRKVHRRWSGKPVDGSLRPESAYQPLATEDNAPASSLDDLQSRPLTERETAQVAAIFSIFWFVANWSINAALEYTSVASATILSSMSGFFTLLIGRFFGVEALTAPRVLTVFASFTGVILVSLSDNKPPTPSPIPDPNSASALLADTHRARPALGDVLALISAIFYAFYVTLLKVRVGDEKRIDMRLFFGLVGFFNLVTLWPVGLICHLTGIERFELPHGRRVIISILVNMAITLSSDYLYVLSMLKTTPLLVTVGLSLTIPLAVLGDFVLLGKPAALQVVAGAALVLVSFVVLGLADAKAEEGQEQVARRSEDRE